MKILITNDDGVGASQLPQLIRQCRKLGEVTAVVPMTEQSGKSHSIEIHNPIQIQQIQLIGDIPVWTVDSTPADCVRFACANLGGGYDLVISGINRGFNLGCDTMYSGTLAAATEAAAKGLPAIALSSSIKYYDRAVEHLEDILAFITDNALLEKHRLYNINIPVDPRGIRITRQSSAAFREEFTPMGNDLYAPEGVPMKTDGSDPALDCDAMVHHLISVTPMVYNRTDLTVYARLTEHT